MKVSLGGRLFDLRNIVLLALIGYLLYFRCTMYLLYLSRTPRIFAKERLCALPPQWTLGAYKYLLATPAFKNATAVSTFLATSGLG